ncbi:FtsX-like permease family protein, partial [candidate division KSB1 bacterium]
MLKNYLKIAYRNIKSNRVYSFINISGLSVSLACCILMFIFISFELSFDNYHENADWIYRVVTEVTHNETSYAHTGTPAPAANFLNEYFPEIENTSRVYFPSFNVFVKSDNKWLEEDKFCFADLSVFEIFTYPFVRGNAANSSNGQDIIILSEKAAERYFGKSNPVGKKLSFGITHRSFMTGKEDIFEYTVAGVVKNIPKNSHFIFDILVPVNNVETISNTAILSDWSAWDFYTYLLLDPTAEADKVSKRLPEFLDKNMPDNGIDAKLYLQELRKIHLYSQIEGKLQPAGSVKYLFFLSTIAVVILIIACINYMNLSIAGSDNRAREVGLRKVVGAQKNQLVKQFMGESVFISFISLPIAIGLVMLFLPAFNDVVNRGLRFNMLSNWVLILALFTLTVSVGIVSGVYPALIISSLQPVKVFRGIINSGYKGALVRRILVVVQFVLSIIFVAGTFVMGGQLDYLKNKDLGIDQDYVLQVPLVYSMELRDNYIKLKNTLLNDPEIQNITSVNNPPFGELEYNPYWWEGVPQDREVFMHGIATDSDFFKTLKIEFIAGENFAGENTISYVINESAVHAMGWRLPVDAVGKPFAYGSYGMGLITGVIKDFHFSSLHKSISPLVLHNTVEKRRSVLLDYILIKMGAQDVDGTLEFIENSWTAIDPKEPFHYTFLNDVIDGLYKEDEKVETIFSYVAFLAVFIASLGLFGLASFSAEQRTREVGIRKAFGASISSIILLISRDFAKLVLIANAIALPVAYFFMEKWLQDFAYRIRLEWDIFIIPAFSAIMIAI